MKRFKLVFHFIYIVVTLAILYFSIDILMNTQAYLSKIKLSSYITFPKYVMGLFLFISILMIIEFAMQQITIHRMSGTIGDMENEIVQLKAKLYDKGDLKSKKPPADESVNDEEEDED